MVMSISDCKRCRALPHALEIDLLGSETPPPELQELEEVVFAQRDPHPYGGTDGGQHVSRCPGCRTPYWSIWWAEERGVTHVESEAQSRRWMYRLTPSRALAVLSREAWQRGDVRSAMEQVRASRGDLTDRLKVMLVENTAPNASILRYGVECVVEAALERDDAETLCRLLPRSPDPFVSLELILFLCELAGEEGPHSTEMREAARTWLEKADSTSFLFGQVIRLLSIPAAQVPRSGRPRMRGGSDDLPDAAMIALMKLLLRRKPFDRDVAGSCVELLAHETRRVAEAASTALERLCEPYGVAGTPEGEWLIERARSWSQRHPGKAVGTRILELCLSGGRPRKSK